jgi:single-stranded DNA-binding protein
MNHVSLSGQISQYGVKIAWSEQGKPPTSFTLVCEVPGKVGAFKTCIAVMVVGPQAEMLAETPEPGDLVLIEGTLAYRPGKTKDAGKLVVVCFGVEKLSEARRVVENPIG